MRACAPEADAAAADAEEEEEDEEEEEEAAVFGRSRDVQSLVKAALNPCMLQHC